MKMLNTVNKVKLGCIFFALLILSASCSLILSVNAQIGQNEIEEKPKDFEFIDDYTVEGYLTMSENGKWEDSQWQFFTTYCAFEENITIILEYWGEVDLDIYVFIDTNSTGTNQKNFADDLTNCEYNEEPTIYSASKTFNTNETGPELIYYENAEFVEERMLYILIFCEQGIGNSSFILQCSNAMEIPEINATCNTEMIAWAGFGAGLFLIFLLTLKIARSRARSEDEKRERKSEKRSKKSKKKSKKNTKKGKSNMSARKGQKRR